MIVGLNHDIRNPSSFPYAQLFAADFDNTVALTFEKSPEGLGVHEVHEITVESMFGSRALTDYVRNGGLRNRAPIEVVQDLAPDVRGDELAQLVDQFIATKLSYSLGQIGSRFPDGTLWPRPTEGYFELCEAIEDAREQKGRLIDTLILSSGHEPFINKTYQVWGLEPPRHVVAEEAVRGLAGLYPQMSFVKPSRALMDVACNIWRSDYGIEPATGTIFEELKQVLYVGDSPEKDGELAAASGVAFVLLDPERSRIGWQKAATFLKLGELADTGADYV